MANFKNAFVLTAILIIAMSSMVSAGSIDNEFHVKTLYAGQNIEAGTVNVSNDCQNIYVTYRMTEDWTLQETHLEVATSFEDIPVTKTGNPIVGHFTYKNGEFPSGTITDTYVIPINGKNGTVYIAAHANVSSHTLNEGAWAAGSSFPGQNWATYFTYDIADCNEEDSEGEEGEGNDGDEGEGNEGEGDEGEGNEGEGDEGEGNEGEGDEGEGNEGEGNEGEGNEGEGNEGEGNEGEGDEGEGDEGEGNEEKDETDAGEENTNNGKKSSSSSGPSRMAAAPGTSDPENDNAYMSTGLDEDIQVPLMSTPEPSYETEDKGTLATIIAKGSNFLWVIIAMLLSGIWIMSGYGLTYP
jgi:hypothetical protein